jgi:ABC-type multidrug transport system permease subunit
MISLTLAPHTDSDAPVRPVARSGKVAKSLFVIFCVALLIGFGSWMWLAGFNRGVHYGAMEMLGYCHKSAAIAWEM